MSLRGQPTLDNKLGQKVLFAAQLVRYDESKECQQGLTAIGSHDIPDSIRGSRRQVAEDHSKILR